jgi:hypothetical protein
MNKASRRPTITIYTGDELRSPLMFCSLATHGLWFRLRLVAHDTERPGILSHLGEPITHELLARKCGTTLEAMLPHLEEITRAGLIAKDTKGFYVIPEVINHEKRKAEWRKNKNKKGDFTVGEESQKNLKRISKDSTPISSSVSSSFSPSKTNKVQEPSKSKDKIGAHAPFSPPGIDDVREFIRSNRYDVQADQWLAHYESNGWKVGRVKMRDWKATVRRWHFSNYGKGGKNGSHNGGGTCARPNGSAPREDGSKFDGIGTIVEV